MKKIILFLFTLMCFVSVFAETSGTIDMWVVSQYGTAPGYTPLINGYYVNLNDDTKKIPYNFALPFVDVYHIPPMEGYGFVITNINFNNQNYLTGCNDYYSILNDHKQAIFNIVLWPSILVKAPTLLYCLDSQSK